MNERELVAECQNVAKAMNAYLMTVGQVRAKGSGTTVGFPDLVLVCSGRVELIEVKRPKTAEHPHGYLTLGQEAVIAKCDDQHVVVHVIDSVAGFVEVVKNCRRR